VHLLHVTFTPSVGRHPSRAIVQSLLLWLCSDFLAERNRSANSHFKEFDYRYVFFWPFMSLLCYEMITGSGVLVCVFLKCCNCVKNCVLELSIDGSFYNNLEFIVVIPGISNHRGFL
jgi:hypothetical protein